MSEELVKAASKLYRIRQSMKILYADKYKERIKVYVDILKNIMVMEGKGELEAMMFAIEKLENEVPDSDAGKMLFMCAAVELIEPS